MPTRSFLVIRAIIAFAWAIVGVYSAYLQPSAVYALLVAFPFVYLALTIAFWAGYIAAQRAQPPFHHGKEERDELRSTPWNDGQINRLTFIGADPAALMRAVGRSGGGF